MGRIAELREKFRKKALAERPDPRLSRFVELVDACIGAKGARVLYTSTPWVRLLHAQADGVADDRLPDWIRERTADLFQSAGAPPRWVDEPTWCFHDDVPLTFVGQMPDASCEDGRELYLFTGTREIDEGEIGFPGHRRFYKMIIQTGYGASDHEGQAGEIFTNGIISL